MRETGTAKKSSSGVKEHTLLTDYDVHLFRQGRHFRLYEKLGSHLTEVDGVEGTHFAVWAPNARHVHVVGDFNAWKPGTHPLKSRPDGSGIWEGFISGVRRGALYKYHIVSNYKKHEVQKGDPFSLYWELPPKTASIVWDLDFPWSDSEWMKERRSRNALSAPFTVYEVHLGSWRRVPEEKNRSLTYRELAERLPEYVQQMGFTHVEFMPPMEHPFYGSWGYETVGYFAPTRRYGTPQDFMSLIDSLHQHDLGVILDWVPSHFPSDEYGLAYFDGTHLYEHADPKKGFHPDWKSCIFNYGRKEVRPYLVSSALFWLEKYHADGLRMDGVASMLYLDYSRREGEWVPNEYGGRENLEAISLIRELNEAIYGNHHDVQTIAEESTAWPGVTRPTFAGGLGFGMKWNMGWMHDTLEYFSKDPIHRKYHHSQLTFGLWYAFSENFMLPLSHDEVVHGKGSLLARMPADEWQKFANLRLLLAYMYGHPGNKLLFMGSEFAQWNEWDHEKSLDWHLLDYPYHQGVKKLTRELNSLYRVEPALNELSFDSSGFEWIDFSDWEQSVVGFLRKSKNAEEVILVVCNFTPLTRTNYRLGVPRDGFWKEILNTDAKEYGGSGHGNLGGIEATPMPLHGREQSLPLTLPPLGALYFKSEGSDQ